MKVCVLQGCSSFYISFTKVCLIKQLSWGYMLSYQSNNAESDRACSNLMKPFFLIISQHNLTKVVSHITCTLYISTSTILFHAQLIFLTFFFFLQHCASQVSIPTTAKNWCLNHITWHADGRWAVVTNSGRSDEVIQVASKTPIQVHSSPYPSLLTELLNISESRTAGATAALGM